MISTADRRKTVVLINTARRDGARLAPACQVAGISTCEPTSAGPKMAKVQAGQPPDRPATGTGEQIDTPKKDNAFWISAISLNTPVCRPGRSFPDSPIRGHYHRFGIKLLPDSSRSR